MGRPVVHWELWSEEASAKILVPRQEVPGVGLLALFEDPEGRVLGLWQQGA